VSENATVTEQALQKLR